MHVSQQLLDKTLKGITADRQRRGTVIEDEVLEEAAVATEAIRALNRSERNIGLARLRAMWFMYPRHHLAGEYNKFMEYVEGELLRDPETGEDLHGSDRDGIMAHARVTDVIFAWLHANPVQSGDERITVEAMLDKPGLDNKLRSSVGLFLNISEEDRAELIRAIWTKGQIALTGYRNDMAKKYATGGNGGDGVRLEEVVLRKKRLSNGKIRFAFDGDVNEQTAAFIETRLSQIIHLEFDEE